MRCLDLEYQVRRAKVSQSRKTIELISLGLLLLEIIDEHRVWMRDMEAVREVVEGGEKKWEVERVENLLCNLYDHYPPSGPQEMRGWQIAHMTELRTLVRDLKFMKRAEE